MNANTGIYTTSKKDGSVSYRVSITYRRKHISLGSYSSYELAGKVYNEARELLDTPTVSIEDYSYFSSIPVDKFIVLINFRDNGIYFHTPIYLRKQYFEYYLDMDTILKFDRDDLFFYSSHKIGKKGGYLFICDYGSQYKIMSRYGIKPFAVYGRDYVMINGDSNDFRYSNIRILSSYMGVTQTFDSGTAEYTAVIHVNGNNLIGKYKTESEAAAAYNKAVDILHERGIKKAYIKNYILNISKEEYDALYNKVSIRKSIYEIIPSN